MPALPGGAAGRRRALLPGRGPGGGGGGPRPLRAKERRVWSVSAWPRPCPRRGTAAAGPEQELCLPPRVGIKGVGPPGEAHRFYGRAGAVRAVPAPGFSSRPAAALPAVSQRPARPG